MTVRILPDTEAIAVEYLLSRTEVTDLAGDRIGTDLDVTQPAALPALRILRVSAPTIARRHLRAGNVQLESWAATDLAAQDLCEVAFAALFEDPPAGIVGTRPDSLGVVTGVDESIGPRRQPDPTTGNPRWLASVIIYAHPQ